MRGGLGVMAKNKSSKKNKNDDNHITAGRVALHIFDRLTSKIAYILSFIIIMTIIILTFRSGNVETAKVFLDFFGDLVEKSHVLVVSIVLNIVFIIIILWLNGKNDSIMKEVMNFKKESLAKEEKE